MIEKICKNWHGPCPIPHGILTPKEGNNKKKIQYIVKVTESTHKS